MEREQIPKNEQETTIVIDPVTKKARIYSCIFSTIKKLESFIGDEDVKLINDDKYGISIEVPMKWIKIAKPKKREFTEEQRNEMRERLEKARAISKENKG